MPVIDIGETSISYHIFGQGVPVLFIPPPVVGACVFYRQVIGLSSKFRVVLFELRGHRRSKSSGEPLTYALLAKDIVHLLGALEIKQAVLCGYSMGAQVAFEFAKSYPDYTLGIIAVSGFSEVSDLRLKSELLSAVKLMDMHAKNTLAFALSLANADTVKALQSMYRTGKTAEDFAIRSMFAHSLDYNCTPDLAHFHVPMQLLFGKWDTRLYRYAQIFKEQLPHVQQVMIPKVSHQIPTRASQALNRSVADFVRQLN